MLGTPTIQRNDTGHAGEKSFGVSSRLLAGSLLRNCNMNDQLKKCLKCKSIKLLAEFYKNSSNKDGFAYYCKICRQRYKRSENARKAYYKYNHSEKCKKARQNYIGSEKDKARQKRYKRNNPLKIKAKDAIHQLVRHGKLPKPQTLKCYYCNEQAQQYHHLHGYEPEHRFDVVPSCQICDIKFHQTRRRELNQYVN